MKVMQTVFTMVAVSALIVLLFLSVEGKNPETCPCSLVGECQFDERGVGYRYRWCGGSCAAYSNWVVEGRCLLERLEWTPTPTP